MLRNNLNIKILTPSGFQNFDGISISNHDKYYSISFDDETSIECTLNHKFMNGGVIKLASDIVVNDFVNHKKVISIELINSNIKMYDLVNVGNGHIYYTNDLISHNCSFIGSSATLLNATTISNLSPEIYTYTKDNFDVLVKPKKNHVYVMVVDTSKGVRGDYSAFVIVDISEENYTVVAKYRSNEISPLLYPSIIVKIAKEYNNAFVLLEINSSEQVAYIVRQEYEYENLLSVVMGKSGQQIGGGFKSGSRYGVNTDKKVKRIGCGNLKNLVESGKLVVRDNDIIKEFSTFVENGKGSYEADDGYNDDLVMCLVLFGWLANDSYFKDLTDTNLRRMMYDEEVRFIEDNLIPFGFLQNNSVADVDKENPFLTL